MVTEPAARALEAYRGRKVILGMRPEHLCWGDGAEGRSFDCVVEVVEQLGSEILVEARLGATRITIARVPAETAVAAGDRVRVSCRRAGSHFFDPDTRKRNRGLNNDASSLCVPGPRAGPCRPALRRSGVCRLRRRRHQGRTARRRSDRAFPP